MLQLLASGFIRRLFQKYVVRDFHPLIFFYGFGALFVAIGFLIGVVEVVLWIRNGAAETLGTILSVVLAIFGLQFLLFAMWFDMENNRALRGGSVASGGSPADPT
jgi:hypothetical protein